MSMPKRTRRRKPPPEIRAAIDSLAQFVGANQIEYGEVAKVWKKKLK